MKIMQDQLVGDIREFDLKDPLPSYNLHLNTYYKKVKEFLEIIYTATNKVKAKSEGGTPWERSDGRRKVRDGRKEELSDVKHEKSETNIYMIYGYPVTIRKRSPPPSTRAPGHTPVSISSVFRPLHLGKSL